MDIHMEIPVVFATDENYLFYTAVAITSMAENAKADTFYKVYILVSGELGKGHLLFDKLQEKYDNLKIHFLPVEESLFRNVHIHNSHVTKATFYRLLLGNLLQEDKCLYLDSDIIVNTDLQELYATELESAYIAGVRDLWLDLMEEEEREERRIKTGIPSMEQYVNAGVLLFHLKKIRRDGMTEKFCAHMQKDYPYEDQDIVNVCCYDHIRRLPAKWNLFTLFMGQREMLEQKGIDKETIHQMKERKGIIHYATPFIRPWESRRFLCNDIWWQYAEIWRDTPEFRRLEKSVRQREIGYSEEATAAYCTAYRTVYIWGFTAFGRSLLNALMEREVNQISAFIDNDAEKQKFTYCGKPVAPSGSINYEPGKCAILIASQKSGKEIQKMLVEKGVREEDIVCFIRKNDYYYQCLRPEFRKEEGFVN